MESAVSSRVATVLHLESDPFCQEAVLRLLHQWPEVCHIGCTASGREGIELCRQKRPTIVLLDLRLPDRDGLECIDALAALPNPLQIMALTSRTDDRALFHAWFGPVRGFIWKTPQGADQLRAAFAAVAAGQRYFSPTALDAIRSFRSSPNAFFKILSKSEQALLPAFSRGGDDQAIADDLGLSRETIRSHRKHILKKLGLRNSMALMTWARDHGFTSGWSN